MTHGVGLRVVGLHDTWCGAVGPVVLPIYHAVSEVAVGSHDTWCGAVGPVVLPIYHAVSEVAVGSHNTWCGGVGLWGLWVQLCYLYTMQLARWQ